MRVGDLQQIMLQTDSVGKVQQQGGQGAEIEQGKLAARQLSESLEESHRVQGSEETDPALIREREGGGQQFSGEPGRQREQPDEEAEPAEDEELRSRMTKTGRHLNVKA